MIGVWPKACRYCGATMLWFACECPSCGKPQ